MDYETTQRRKIRTKKKRFSTPVHVIVHENFGLDVRTRVRTTYRYKCRKTNVCKRVNRTSCNPHPLQGNLVGFKRMSRGREKLTLTKDKNE